MITPIPARIKPPILISIATTAWFELFSSCGASSTAKSSVDSGTVAVAFSSSELEPLRLSLLLSAPDIILELSSSISMADSATSDSLRFWLRSLLDSVLPLDDCLEDEFESSRWYFGIDFTTFPLSVLLTYVSLLSSYVQNDLFFTFVLEYSTNVSE